MQQIADWLETLGMSEYAERFAESDIDNSVLRDLTDQEPQGAWYLARASAKDVACDCGACRCRFDIAAACVNRAEVALTCFVSFPARARRKPSAANLAPAAERGRRRSSVLANRWRRGGGGAGGELGDELPGRLERQADRPIGGLAEFMHGAYNASTLGRRYYRPIGPDPALSITELRENINETIDAWVFDRLRLDSAYRPSNLA